jgi:hypothetical protein
MRVERNASINPSDPSMDASFMPDRFIKGPGARLSKGFITRRLLQKASFEKEENIAFISISSLPLSDPIWTSSGGEVLHPPPVEAVDLGKDEKKLQVDGLFSNQEAET